MTSSGRAVGAPELTMPSWTPEQRSVIAAADGLFTECGFVPVELADVADRADVDVTAVRDSFPTKRDLMVGVLQYWHQGWTIAVDRIGATATDPRDEILQVFTHLESCFDEDWRGCAFINGYAELGRQDPEIARLAEAHFADVERRMAVLCARAGLPNHVAGALSLLIEGARVESAVHASAQPARTARMGAAALLAAYTGPAGDFPFPG